jgi:plasmid maintenance system antidote protein VapI
MGNVRDVVLNLTFADFVKQVVVERFDGVDYKLAEAIGVVPSQVSRVGKGGAPFGVVTCLRLAKVAAASPSDVLHLAGRDDVAALVDSLYGAERRPMTQDERLLVALPDKTKASLVRALAALGAALADQTAARDWNVMITSSSGNAARVTSEPPVATLSTHSSSGVHIESSPAPHARPHQPGRVVAQAVAAAARNRAPVRETRPAAHAQSGSPTHRRARR